MKNCAFTICATNYIGLAKVLESSIKKHYHEVDFYIVVADEPKETIAVLLEDNVIIARNALNWIYSEEKWNEMAFKYDLTEFCTAIKPASIKYLFEKGYEKCIYFDPDIFVFSCIEDIFKELDKYHAIVTPHITQIGLAEMGNIPEHQLLCSGVYNLGFLGLKKTNETEVYLDWWERKLEEKCFASIPENLFTDQKWMDLMPCFFGNSLCVSQNLGLNMAPWNFHERKIKVVENELFVVSRKDNAQKSDRLVFVHFSGYNYSALLKNGSLDNRNIKDMEVYDDLKAIFNIYRDNLKQGSFSKYVDSPYTYNYFSDGTMISKELRRLYRALVEIEVFQDNPFCQDSHIYKKAKERRIIGGDGGKNGIASSRIGDADNSRKKKGRAIMNAILRLLYKCLGLQRYLLVCRIFRFYGFWENHYFLVMPKGTHYKIRSLY